MAELKWADAWQQLVYDHTPFRPVDADDYRDLVKQSTELEQLFLLQPRLRWYYDELTGRGTAESERSPDDEVVHVAAMQLQLMESAFFTLRLDRYANCPDNRGWMNLFRQWTMSPTFRRHADELDPTFSRQFIQFYQQYILNWPIDVPVPHPWDVRPAARREQPPKRYAGATMRGIQNCLEWRGTGLRGKGIFLDPGRIEAGPPSDFEEPERVEDEQHGTGSGGTPPSTPATDSSSSTD